MNYGLTESGFEIKRLETIKAEVEQELRDVFGSINTNPDSVFGQIIGVFSKVLADLWEQLENIYFSQYPDTAEGVALNHAVALTGITRLGATESTALAALQGTTGTTIAAASQISVENEGSIFSVLDNTIIQNASIERIFVNVLTVADSTAYIVTIDGTPYSITSGVGATKLTIAAALVLKINTDQTNVDCTDYLNGAFICRKSSSDFTLTVSANLEWYTPAEVQALEKGSISAPQSSLTIIETPISGWDAVTNFQDATQGRDEETDAELRLRRLESLQISNAATPEAIRSRMLQNVDNVLDAFVIENETDLTDGDGRPPHSFETIVSGGTDADIAEEIWQAKPAGIQTFGTESASVIDSQGNAHTIYFSRPTQIPIYIIVTVTVNPEETYPDNGDSQIADKLVEYFESLQIANNVLYQKLFGIIYEVPGISSVVLKIGTAPAPTGTANIAISATELAVTSLSNITVSH